MFPSGPPTRGSLARLAQATLCPACGRALRDPVLLACEHSCCRHCLRRDGPGDTDGTTGGTATTTTGGGTVSCPRCRLPCAPKRIRTPVALAVESRIAQRLATGEPAGTPRRRGGR
ncbi:hypothetical protein AV530_010098 [Patagioenas fasciata monilis]|uniref:RING-type domain-containing protein n=1 Tax=Patagioenas fasciata monilis TaxID=372326 RepID=A0A1V4K8L3_PATFA|nr:hypothetical protein AV530_010098 [Patagioenas fasciata monilis]